MTDDHAVANPSESTQTYRYDAFISYRHVDPDRGWAKWLHQAIETYRIPKVLRDQPGFTPLLRRVFRDEEELPVSSNLSREIDEALDQSRFLIVICSPKTPESSWCCAEIERFRAMGRDDRILALLVEGEPKTSFPKPLRQITRTVTLPDGTTSPQVREVEPLAADVRSGRTESQRSLKRAARLRFIACIMGCRYDDLRQREQIRQNRRKTLAVGVMAILLAVMSTLSVIAVIQADRARKAQALATRQRDVALETLNALIIEAYDKLQDRPGARQLQDALLELALAKLDEVNLDINADSGAADHSAAVAMRRRGNLFLLAGRTTAAADLISRSLEILEALARQSPNDSDLQAQAARTSHLMGKLSERQGDIKQAEMYYQRALTLRNTLALADPSNLRLQRELGESYEYVGDVTLDLGQTEAAARYYEKSLATRQLIVKTDAGQPNAVRDMATAHSKLGDVNRQLGSLSDAREHYEQSMELFGRLAGADAYNTRAQRDLAVAYNKLGSISQLMNQLPQAKEYYEKSLATTEALAMSDRGNLQWQRELAVCHSNLGFVNLRLNQSEAALDDYKRSLAIARELARADPVDLEGQRGLADAYQLLGDARKQINEYPQALKNYEESLAIRRRLAEADPQNVQLQRDLSIALSLMGQLNRQAGQTVDARNYFEQMLAIRQKLAVADPANAQLQRDLSIAHVRVGMSSDGADRVRAFSQAVTIRRRLVELDDSQSAAKQDLATGLHLLGLAHARAGELQASRDALAEAADLFGALVEAHPGDGRMLGRLAVSLQSLVDVDKARQAIAAAIKGQDELCQVRRQLSDAMPEDLQAYLSWVVSLINAGDLYRDNSQPAPAKAAYEQARRAVERVSTEGQIGQARSYWLEQIQSRLVELPAAAGGTD